MNAECRELKAHIMARFDIESIIEEGGIEALEDTIAMANNMYFIDFGYRFSIEDCYTVACNLLEEY